MAPGRVAALSVGVASLVLALKTLAWALTGSVALLSDALESVVNVGTAAAAFAALRVAARPADERHPWGHHKAERVSAGAVGVLIALSALLILRETWEAARAPAPVAGATARTW